MLAEFRTSWNRQSEAVEAGKHVGVLRRELMEMAASIEQARREVAALRPADGAGDKILSATNELDAIVISTERASFEILNAAERLMDLAGKLRAAGADPGLCGEIDGEVNNIFTACSFQDLTGQRTSKVVNALRYIEQRVIAMINIWGEDGLAGMAVAEENTDKRPDAHLLNGPQLDGHGVSQADVDSMFDAPVAAAPPPPHRLLLLLRRLPNRRLRRPRPASPTSTACSTAPPRCRRVSPTSTACSTPRHRPRRRRKHRPRNRFPSRPALRSRQPNRRPRHRHPLPPPRSRQRRSIRRPLTPCSGSRAGSGAGAIGKSHNRAWVQSLRFRCDNTKPRRAAMSRAPSDHPGRERPFDRGGTRA